MERNHSHPGPPAELLLRPRPRSLALALTLALSLTLQELAAVGLRVGAASDNVRDWWHPYGDYDALQNWKGAITLAHLGKRSDHREPITHPCERGAVNCSHARAFADRACDRYCAERGSVGSSRLGFSRRCHRRAPVCCSVCR